MYSQKQIDSILYQSWSKVGEIALQVTQLKNKGVQCDILYKRGYCLLRYLKAHELGTSLTQKEKDALLKCMIEVSGIRSYPTLAPILFRTAPALQTGQPGPKGDQGETGSAGPTGADGAQGAQGADGPLGPQGPQGDTGAAGSVGTAGPQGDQGIQGIQGDQGIQGNNGPQGADGVIGPAGPEGPEGPTGTT
ncbi:MAG TPA: collagen-like protein, partial [Candidatus Aminicenantes bacterium]|nr:collagen-like protein [Candidatus Aminicenantes bacterium]